MKCSKSLLRVVLLVSGMLVVLGISAQAVTVEVGSCVTGFVQFGTIQAAVTASPAGTIIDVCPGTYPEQITINKNLTIQGIAVNNQDAAVITSPSGGVAPNTTDVDTGESIAAQILVVSPATSVKLTNLVVDGANNGITGCAPDLQGVLFQNASGTIDLVTTRNQFLGGSLGGCQSGEGIYVQTASGNASTVTVRSASVHDFQKNGITGNDLGTTLNVTSSRVEGLGVVQPMNAAQNGIQLAFGAKGTITGNFVADFVYGDINIAIATGILLYDTLDSSNIQVNTNTVANTQGAVVLYTEQDDGVHLGNGVTANGNNISATPNFDAIDVCTNSNTIENNTIYNSNQSAIHLDASCSGFGSELTGNSNIATHNNMSDSGCAGVLVDPTATGNTTSPNTFAEVPNTVLNGTCPSTPSKPNHSRKVMYSPKGRK